MNYIGSKLKLSSWIEEEVKKVVGDEVKEEKIETMKKLRKNKQE